MTKRSLPARLLWGGAAGGLTFLVLSVSGLSLAPPVMAAACAGGALLGALLGPLALEILAL